MKKINPIIGSKATKGLKRNLIFLNKAFGKKDRIFATSKGFFRMKKKSD